LITASVNFVYIPVDGHSEENRKEFICTHFGKSEAEVTNNKCIGDDTTAVARRSQKYSRKTKIIRPKTIFNMAAIRRLEF